MKHMIRRWLPACAAWCLSLALSAGLFAWMRQTLTGVRRSEAENILHFYVDNIEYKLQGKLSGADALAQTAYVMKDRGSGWFERAAEILLEREEVRYVCLIEGDTVTEALPEALYGGQAGRGLDEFSYIYTMAKVVKELVVEGPVVMEGDAGGREVFLFLQPFTEENAYLGEIVVALDRDYVLDQLGFGSLSERGYAYELWRVEPQNGGKEVITVSDDETDFSSAVKETFYLPTQWNISIQPADGWFSPGENILSGLLCLGAMALMLSLMWSLAKLRRKSMRLNKLSLTDSQTGMWNRKGFTAELESGFSKREMSVSLFLFVFEGYDQVAQLIGPEEEAAFLKSIPQKLADYIHNPFFAGRLSAGSFAAAVCEEMSDQQLEDFARGLSLELILKVRINGKKSFLTARYRTACFRPGESSAEAALGTLISAYYEQRAQESPVRRLRENCMRLIEGKSDVTFDEYSDIEMTELSKTFNQYRRQVEQLAYFDPAFHVGNRSKYLRDAGTLINYDKKRPFHLFCIDICAFSQYNEMFSAETGDAILNEVIHRLSRTFGTYLYRINGDVFLGLMLTDETEERVTQRLHDLLAAPVVAGNTSFSLQVRVAACRYPESGGSPDALLDRIQSALRHAKESGRKTVIYDLALDQAIRMESEILHRMRASVRRGELEVWYQPLMHLGSGRFTAVEALVRLPDGNGGYYSSEQVVDLAERRGMVKEFGDYVLDRAGRFMNSQGSELGLLRMCVNLSVQQLLVGNSVEQLLELIRSTGVKADQITLEITESILIQSVEFARGALEQLRQTGLHIALDDFGAGYSSLNYLFNLPVDVVKIDRSLTSQIRTNPKQNTLLRAIVKMAKINSLTVVLEGIETPEEQELIKTSGAEFVQGFCYARPMREDELVSFLKERNLEKSAGSSYNN